MGGDTIIGKFFFQDTLFVAIQGKYVWRYLKVPGCSIKGKQLLQLVVV